MQACYRKKFFLRKKCNLIFCVGDKVGETANNFRWCVRDGHLDSRYRSSSVHNFLAFKFFRDEESSKTQSLNLAHISYCLVCWYGVIGMVGMGSGLYI
jgi:hypothetical protein